MLQTVRDGEEEVDGVVVVEVDGGVVAEDADGVVADGVVAECAVADDGEDNLVTIWIYLTEQQKFIRAFSLMSFAQRYLEKC